MSDNLKKGIIAILIFAILGLIYYNLYSTNRHIVVQQEMQLEKDIILNDLAKLENKYDKEILKNTSLSKELLTQKKTILDFRSALRSSEKTNKKLINFYKLKIKNLTNISDNLIRISDSLSRENNNLTQKNINLTTQKDSLNSNLKNQTTFNNKLVEQNLDLAKKIALGEIVTASNFNVVTYRERNNGSFKESDKARRVDAFKTSFILNENPIATEEDIITHVVITKPDGKLLVNKGSFSTPNGKKINFSNSSTIPYKKTGITSDIVTKFGNQKPPKGTYIIDFYIKETKVGSVEKTLH